MLHTYIHRQLYILLFTSRLSTFLLTTMVGVGESTGKRSGKKDTVSPQPPPPQKKGEGQLNYFDKKGALFKSLDMVSKCSFSSLWYDLRRCVDHNLFYVGVDLILYICQGRICLVLGTSIRFMFSWPCFSLCCLYFLL